MQHSEQIIRLEAEVLRLQLKCADAEQAVTLQQDICEKTEETNQMQGKCVSLEGTVADLTSNLMAKDAIINELKKEIGNLKAINSSIEAREPGQSGTAEDRAHDEDEEWARPSGPGDGTGGRAMEDQRARIRMIKQRKQAQIEAIDRRFGVNI